MRHHQGFLTILIFFQLVTLLFWLPLSAHSGQTSIPWLMNRGLGLFDAVLEQHAPATSIIAALAQRALPFLSVLTVARLLNALLMTVITLIVYRITWQLSHDYRAALLSATIWFWLGPVYGNILFYFNTLLALCVLLAMYVWITTVREHSSIAVFGAGLFLGAATLAKQPGWIAVIMFGIWLFAACRSWRLLALYVFSSFLLPLLTIGIIALQGNLETYIYWNWEFNLSGYMDTVPPDSDFVRKLLLTNVFVFPYLLTIWQHRDTYRGGLLILMFVATASLIYPRAGESAAVSHIPFTAIMSGIVLNSLWREWQTIGLTKCLSINLGIVATIVLGWLWMGLVMYVPSTLGVGQTPAYDEFEPIVSFLGEVAEEGDTLFVLPETDSTPQIHPQTNLLPPRMWIKGWRWYLQAPGVVNDLLDEWRSSPPTFVVVFSGLVVDGMPGIESLLEFVDQNYSPVYDVENIPFHGPAVVYRYARG